MIDVRDLIARHSHDEHVIAADRYYANAVENEYYWRKPFASADDMPTLMRACARLTEGLDFYPGVRVLDFGAGSCWTSKIFAYLGCRVTALDVSRNALDLGKKIIDSDPLAEKLDIRYLPFDSKRIEIPSEGIDRIVCMDCFHHVADQRATLEEFYRILTSGGSVGFYEPGPRHSQTEQAQYEMRNYGVIENDIVMEEIWAIAQEVGFSKIDVTYASGHRVVSIDEFNQLVSGDAPDALAKRIIDSSAPEYDELRVFFLRKGEGQQLDSRRRRGLAHKLTIDFSAGDAGNLEGCGTASNTGIATWLPTGDGVGAVNVGVHLYDASGRLLNLDYARIPLSSTAVLPGDAAQFRFSIARPSVSDFELVFDLVAEHIGWFGTDGNDVVRYRSERSPGS